MAGVTLVATSAGDARITTAQATRPRALLALGHGAGGGIEAPDLVALVKALPPRGITVVRIEQPYRVAGKSIGPRPEVLDAAWREVIAELAPTTPLIVGGRSAGARVACRTATATGAVAVVALAFPLHPPGRPDRSRADELIGSGVPTLVIQGRRDHFGRPEEFPTGTYELIVVDDADHGFALPKSAKPAAAERLRIMARSVGDWLTDLLQTTTGIGGPRAGVDAW